MAKTKLNWACVECGHNQPKWAGQCPACLEWNTLQEEVQEAIARFVNSGKSNKPQKLSEVALEEPRRMLTGIEEVDRLIGGGLVPGSFTLVGGEPGIGKSTLLLQMAAESKASVLYIAGEESAAQISLRAKRLGIQSDMLILSETNFAVIQEQARQLKPDILIIDSIQIIYKPEIPSAPGSVVQVRECAVECMHLAKSFGISVILIGHVTKSGEIAGPKVLEHLVDTVLYFEGDRQHQLRILRVVKNRFGGVDEVAVFQMAETGLVQVKSPSELFLQERLLNNPGSVIIPTLEGSRPILVEVQALVSQSIFQTPSRRCTGIDSNRLALLLAVLEKRLSYPLFQRDVFVSVAGGLKISEPAVDLGVLLAIASSMTCRPIHPEVVVIGEVGLGGEVRSVSKFESRLKEAIHMGFSCALCPKKNLEGFSTDKIRTKGIDFVEEAIDVLL